MCKNYPPSNTCGRTVNPNVLLVDLEIKNKIAFDTRFFFTQKIEIQILIHKYTKNLLYIMYNTVKDCIQFSTVIKINIKRTNAQFSI